MYSPNHPDVLETQCTQHCHTHSTATQHCHCHTTHSTATLHTALPHYTQHCHTTHSTATLLATWHLAALALGLASSLVAAATALRALRIASSLIADGSLVSYRTLLVGTLAGTLVGTLIDTDWHWLALTDSL